MILCFQSMQAYVIDSFTLYSASALAAVSCFRSLAGFGFPLFAPAMYNSLGYGKGNTGNLFGTKTESVAMMNAIRSLKKRNDCGGPMKVLKGESRYC